ncbi:MAG: hypothetical protein FWD58_01575 [Firmicutes bacterium]|nr:hypothetical protein [Bacillota bacterium]
MSIKRTYKVESIFFLSKRGLMFILDKEALSHHIYLSSPQREILLFANGKSLAVKLKGIESASGKAGHRIALALSTPNDDKKEMREFLGMDKSKKGVLENAENVYIEIEYFIEQEIQKILNYESNERNRKCKP